MAKAKYKKRADGRYLVQIKKGVKENGKPDYENIYAATIPELESKIAAFRVMLEKGVIIDDEGLTVKAWAERWLQVYKSGKELNTYKMYKSATNKHIIPALGVYKLKDLKKHHVQAFINGLAQKGYSKTIVIVKQTLTQMLERAVEDELIYKNAAAKIDMPVIRKPKKRSLTSTERGYILKADFDKQSRAYAYTLLFAGLRRGEVLALTKKDVDFNKKVIIIDKAVVVDGNKTMLKPYPKSKAGCRTVPMPDILADALHDYLTDLTESASVYVFHTQNGELMTQSSFRRLWEKILRHMQAAAGEKDGLKVALADDITMHLLRHTYATDLYYAGVDIKAAQYLLGHSSVNMTLEIYTHLDRSNDAITAERINNYHNAALPSQSKISQTRKRKHS